MSFLPVGCGLPFQRYRQSQRLGLHELLNPFHIIQNMTAEHSSAPFAISRPESVISLFEIL